jgi:hypothetical protein
VAEFLKNPIVVPNEVDNLVFKGQLKGRKEKKCCFNENSEVFLNCK